MEQPRDWQHVQEHLRGNVKKRWLNVIAWRIITASAADQHRAEPFFSYTLAVPANPAISDISFAPYHSAPHPFALGMFALGVDAGGSSTKWCLVRGGLVGGRGEVVAQGRTAPLTAHLLASGAGAEALEDLWKALPAAPHALFLGLAGLGTASAVGAVVAQSFESHYARPPSYLRLVNDLELAYQTHFEPGQGILVYAGTGSIAYHISAAGEAVRAGGRGYRIGDDGSGASLGRAALRWATDCLDWGQPPAGPLAQEIERLTGGLDWDTLRAFVYGTPGAASLARLAPAVTEAALRGDGTALNLLRDAAQSLAHLGTVLQRRLVASEQAGAQGEGGPEPLPVVATGGALSSLPLQEALRRALPGVQILQKDHAQAAALCALELL